ncbi:MAG TPA: Coq4 family protein [Rhizomicrobium sp.]|nr:Coq4 family protein [Rhizomicrobium sp.]
MRAEPASDTRLHPLEAVRAVRRLFATGDTKEIFAIFRALRGRSGVRAFSRFCASPTGSAVLRERRRLLDTLTDRARLAALPQGSVGRTYFDFMEEENLSAEGLVQASQNWDHDPVPPDFALYRERMRDAHDLTHVLTGYGRDPLGEICLLAFMYAHSRNLGMALIVAMGWPRLPPAGRRAVTEGWRNGRKTRWLQDQDFEALLPRPLQAVRRELGIADPLRYRATPS